MRMNYEGLKDTQAWQKAGIELPSYDPQELAERTRKNPLWVHFGIGNIFRIFIGGIADKRVLGSLCEALKAPGDFARLKEIFAAKSYAKAS